MEITPLPCLLTVFGALGDLAGRKLFPALFNLHRRKLLHDNSGIIACGRRPMSHDEFRAYVRTLPELGNVPDAEMAPFLRRVYYLAGDYLRDETVRGLAALLDQAGKELGCTDSSRIFYLAVGPDS